MNTQNIILRNIKYLLLLITLIFSISVTYSSNSVSLVEAYQEGRNIIITYQLSERADIEVYVSTDGGKNYHSLRNLTGDFGKNVEPGNKKINWDVLSQFDKFSFSDVCFKIETSKKSDLQTIDTKDYEYVDLGLSSGTLWATCNIGATKPEEYGDYFAWGESETKLEYSVQNYSYKNKSNTISLENDVAYKKWGKNWRLPSKKEIEELYSECIWEETNYKNVVGYKVISKKNGNYLFIPAGGFRFGNQYVGRGSLCYFWSNLLLNENLAYGSGSAGVSGYYKYDGISVRPVLNK